MSDILCSGFMIRGGSGWEASLIDSNKQWRRLSGVSELQEPLRQAADLVMGDQGAAYICGSQREFLVKKSQLTGARFVMLPICGITWMVAQNMKEGQKSQIRLTMLTDFEGGNEPIREDDMTAYGDDPDDYEEDEF